MFCIVDTASHRPDDHRCFIGFGPPRLDVPPRPSGHTSKKRPSSSTATISPPLRFISPSLASPCRASTPKKHSDEQHNAWKADGSCVRPSGPKTETGSFCPWSISHVFGSPTAICWGLLEIQPKPNSSFCVDKCTCPFQRPTVSGPVF